MSENTPQDVNRIQEEAQKQDREAKKAQEVVDDAISKMTPQRQYEKEKEQNKRYSETSISGGFPYPPLIVSRVLVSLRSPLALRSIDTTNPIGSTKPLPARRQVSLYLTNRAFTGSLTPAYPPLIPLSLEVGVLLPVRLR